MESGGRRNPDLGDIRGRDDNDYVDYDEEQEEQRSTRSDDTRRTETSADGRVDGILTQLEDGFNPRNENENENDSHRESVHSSYHSESSYQRSEYDGEGFLKSYIPIA